MNLTTCKKIGNNLTKAMKNKNISREELAEKIGISLSKLEKYLNGTSMPSLDILANICKTLCVSSNDILSILEIQEKMEIDMLALNQIETNLVNAIKNSGMTESEIVDKIGASVLFLQQICDKKRLPPLYTFANLCRVLNADANEILCLPIKK